MYVFRLFSLSVFLYFYSYIFLYLLCMCSLCLHFFLYFIVVYSFIYVFVRSFVVVSFVRYGLISLFMYVLCCSVSSWCLYFVRRVVRSLRRSLCTPPHPHPPTRISLVISLFISFVRYFFVH